MLSINISPLNILTTNIITTNMHLKCSKLHKYIYYFKSIELEHYLLLMNLDKIFKCVIEVFEREREKKLQLTSTQKRKV